MIKSYVSIDLETTGLNPKTDKIIEIGAVKVIHGERREQFVAYVNPGRKLEKRIVELTGIRDEDLKEASAIEEVFPKLLCFLEDLPLLGHSVLFDYSFLKKAALDQNLSFEKSAVDTLKIARKYLPELESRSLDYLCSYYGISHQAHRAGEDAAATDILYRRLSEQFFTKEETLFFPQKLNFKIKRDQPARKSQIEKLYRLKEQHKLSLDMDIERLSRSEASRLIDQILQSVRQVGRS